LLLLAIYVVSLTAPGAMSREEYNTLGYYPLAQVREISDFNLIDEHGKRFGLERLKGQWSLLFFGYTYCPDVCPVTMVQINRALNQLKPQTLNNLKVALVSVDPERDTLEILDKYVKAFNDSFSGVTGEPDEIKKFAAQLNIAFARGLEEEPGTYLVDHSGSIAVIDPEGRYHGSFRPPHQENRMASVIGALMR
jgi:protein SCO1/2